jgi:hypothetical protein
LRSRTKSISRKRRHKRLTDGNSLNIIFRLVSKIERNKRAITMINVVYKPIILLRKENYLSFFLIEHSLYQLIKTEL